MVQVELNDLKKHILQRRKSEKEIQKHYLKGSLPRLGMCQFYDRPLYLDWAIRTQELTLDRDANNWIDFTTYATNGLRIKIENNRSQLLAIEVPEEVDEIVIDYSALITLHQLGLLEKVQKRFKKIYYPQILEMVWVNDQPHFTHHQKSKSETYKGLQKRIDRGEIKQIAAPDPQKNDGGSMDALYQRNLRLALLEKAPYLDNFTEIKDLKGFEQVQVLRLPQVAKWLFSRGKIGEKRFRSILEKHKSQKAEPLLKNPDKIIEESQSLIVAEITLELLEEENLIPLMLDLGVRIAVEKATAFSIINAAQSIRFIKAIGERHREMVRIVKESPAFVHVTVNTQEDWDGDIYWQAAVAPLLYADSNRHLLLTDDRTLQMIPGKEGKNDFFGTDVLLATLFRRGAIPLERYALDFYQLCKWRYRFLIPNVKILYFFANQYRKRPLGQHLNDLVDYSRHCLQDPGMFWGREKTEPPLPLAFKFQMAWHDVWLELLIRLWSEGEWKEDELYRFTRKVFRQALPGLPDNVAPKVRDNLVQVEQQGLATRLFIATPNLEEPTRLHGLYELTFEYLGFDDDQKVRSLRDYVGSALSIPEIGNDTKVFRRGIFIPLLEAFYGTTKTFPSEPLLAEIYEQLDMLPGDVEGKGEPPSPEQNELLAKIRASQKDLEDVESPLIIISEPEKKERVALAPHEMLADGLSPFRREALEYLLLPGKVSKNTRTWLKDMSRKILHARPSIWRPAGKLAKDVVLRDFRYCRSLFSKAMGMSPPNDGWVQAAWFNAVAKPDWDSAWDEAPSWIQELKRGGKVLQGVLQDALRNVLGEQEKMIDDEQSDFRESDPVIRALNWYDTNIGFLPFAPLLDPWSFIANVLNLEWNDREPKGALKEINAGKINFQGILEKASSWVVAKNGRDRVAWVLALNLVLNARGRNIDHDATVSSSGKDFILFMNRCFKGLFEMDQDNDSNQETIDYQMGRVLFHIRCELAVHYMRSMALDEWGAASNTEKNLLAWWMAREVTYVIDQVSSGMEAHHQINWLKSVVEKNISKSVKPNIIRHAFVPTPKPLTVEYFVTLHGGDTLPAGSALAIIGPHKDGANPCFRGMIEPSRALTKPGRDGMFPVMMRQCAYGLNQIPVIDAIEPDVLWNYPATVTGPEFLQAYYGDELAYLGDEKNGIIEFCKAISDPNFLDKALDQLPEILENNQDVIIAATFSGLRTYGLTRGHLPESVKILADTQLPETMDRQKDFTRQTAINSLLELLIQLLNWGETQWVSDIESFLKALDVRKCEPFAESYTMGIGLATLQGADMSLWDMVVKTGKIEKKFRDALAQFKKFLNDAFPFLPASAMDRARMVLSSMDDIFE